MRFDPLAVAWTVLMSCGLAVFGALLWRAMQIAQRLRTSGQNGLTKLAVGKSVRLRRAICAFYLSYAFVGLAGMYFSPETPAYITFPVTIGCLFGGALYILVSGLLELRDDRAIDLYADATHDRRSNDPEVS